MGNPLMPGWRLYAPIRQPHIFFLTAAAVIGFLAGRVTLYPKDWRSECAAGQGLAAAVPTASSSTGLAGTKNGEASLSSGPRCLAQQTWMQDAISSAKLVWPAHGQTYSVSSFLAITHSISGQLLKAVQPVLQQAVECPSIVLVPPCTASKDNRCSSRGSQTALLLVLSSAAGVPDMVGNFSALVLTHALYAQSHGYALHLYVHKGVWPASWPRYMVKVLGVRYMMRLGFKEVLGMDWDTVFMKRGDVPLSYFFDEMPNADVLVQAEAGICAGAILYRNTPRTARFLKQWWDITGDNCCLEFPHDQGTFFILLTQHVSNLCPGLAPTDIYLLNMTYMQPCYDLLRGKSMFGLVGSSVVGQSSGAPFPPLAGAGVSISMTQMPVGLHGCAGLWGTCVETAAPTLLRHFGNGNIRRVHLLENTTATVIVSNVLVQLRQWMCLHAAAWAGDDWFCRYG